MDKTLERHCLEGCFTFHAILFPIESEIQAGWKLVSARICANIDPCPLLSQAADSSRNLFESPATVFPSLMTTMRPGAPSSSLSPGGALTTASGTTFRDGDGDGASSFAAVEKEVELPDVACSSAPSPSSEEFCGATIHL